jgi:hypothetical protein
MALKDSDDGKPEAEEAEVSLDLSQAAVKRMIADAKERGYITYEQLNQVMPPDQVSGDQIEDVMAMLSEMGINVVEDDDVEEGEPVVGGEGRHHSHPRLRYQRQPCPLHRPKNGQMSPLDQSHRAAKYLRSTVRRAK